MHNLYSQCPDAGCDQQRIMFFSCYCYGEAHHQHIMSVANNGRCINTCITTKDFVNISHYVYHDGTADRIRNTDMPNMQEAHQYQTNKIIAEKWTNVCINQCLRPHCFSKVPGYSVPCSLNQHADINCQTVQAKYHHLMYRAFLEKTKLISGTTPPPGFYDCPKIKLSLNLTDLCKPRKQRDDDLDVNKLIEEFKTQSKIHVEYEKRIIFTRFFVMNLKFKILQFLKKKYKVSEDENINPELFKMPMNLLKRLGFDVIFMGDEEIIYSQSKAEIRNNLAMEFVNNDFFANDIIDACNSRFTEKRRMPYTKMFDSTS